MIEIKNLKTKVGEKEIIKGIDLKFENPKNYLILGKNGSGKSSLFNFLMGDPIYEYISGTVKIDGKDLLEMEVNERNHNGLFLSFQNVPEIPGINLAEYLRTIYNNFIKKNNKDIKDLSPFIFKRFIKKYLEELSIPENFLQRELNVGFSGGEKRKIELLQASLLHSKYIILDEIDSGLDINAFKVVANHIKKINNQNNSIIMITHLFRITEYINFDEVYILENGKIKEKGGVDILEKIEKDGFN